MAIYQLSMSIVSRGNGGELTTRNAVAAAAYQAREALYDERLQTMRDPTHDASDLVRTEILLPEAAPYRWFDREVLWNEVEAREQRKDAQLARSVILTLPRELDPTAGADLARDFFHDAFVRRGMVVDMAVHTKNAVDLEPNPHAHALLTIRPIIDGAFGPKVQDWKSRLPLILEWRREWAHAANRRLAAFGVPSRIDHRRGIQRPKHSNPKQAERNVEERHTVRDAARLARAAAIIAAATVTQAVRDLAWRLVKRSKPVPVEPPAHRTPVDVLREDLQRPLHEAAVGVATRALTYREALDRLISDHLEPAVRKHPELDERFDKLANRIGDGLAIRASRLNRQIQTNAAILRERSSAVRENVMSERVAGAGLTQAEKIETAQQEARWQKIEATPEFRKMEASVEAMISAVSTGEAPGFNYERDWSPRAAQSARDQAWKAAPTRAATEPVDEAARRSQAATADRSHVASAG